MEQILYFLSDDTTRIEFHVTEQAPGCWLLDSRFNPRHDPDVMGYTSLADLADAIEDRVRPHFAENRSQLNRIELRRYHPIDIRELWRYGVSLLPVDMGPGKNDR